MRVVGGLARGRTLQAPAGRSTRPTSDRVREAVFSMLTSMDLLEGSAVLDLFAGSGALGIESVSRGAASALLVDSSADAIHAIQANLAVLGPEAVRVRVVRSEALRFLAGSMGGSPEVFDVAFADPPYRFSAWPEVLARLQGRARCLVVETGEPWEAGPEWETVKVRRYGASVVSVVQEAAQAGTVRAEEGES